MQDEITRTLFERVLEAVTRSEGELDTLLDALLSFEGDIRAMSLVRALLAADVTLEETFADAAQTLRERQLARRTALTLAASADRIEAAMPDRVPVRVSDLEFDRALRNQTP